MFHNALCCLLAVLLLFIWTSAALSDCHVYTPSFPPPELDIRSKAIQKAQHDIESTLKDIISEAGYDRTSFSVAVTSSKETLFEVHHTARDRDENRPGAKVIDGISCYRIASCTKAFTVLALLQQVKAGKLNLDDPVNKYIAELNTPQNGTLPWKDITLRTLATQLSGIPRDIGQAEILASPDNPIELGLPPLSPSQHYEVQCDSIVNYTRPCTRTDLLDSLKNSRPIYAPKQQSTYSNLNYELLSLVLANITSTPYETLIQRSILDMLNMTSTSFTKPPDSVAALPKGEYYYWDVIMGVQNPTGGLITNTDDLTKFLRFVLNNYNGLGPAVNWIHPVSAGHGLNSFYGMPWEILRTDKILPYTNRPVTFVAKGGGLPGYTSQIVTVPDYDFGFTILTAGNSSFTSRALDAVGVTVVRAADDIAQAHLRTKYRGTWSAPAAMSLNSSFTLSHALDRDGLYVDRFVSNGTDVLATLGRIYFPYTQERFGSTQFLQAVPTLLFRDELNKRGEVWRLIGRRLDGAGADTDTNVENNDAAGLISAQLCYADIDSAMYGGLAINEIVFWDERDDGTFGSVELNGFRITLVRDGQEEEEMKTLVVQQ